jgi:hypothetical protein
MTQSLLIRSGKLTVKVQLLNFKFVKWAENKSPKIKLLYCLVLTILIRQRLSEEQKVPLNAGKALLKPPKGVCGLIGTHIKVSCRVKG